MQFAERIFMENCKNIIENQKKINEYMEKYEFHTQKLLNCDIDDIEGHVDARGEILSKIDFLHKKVLAECSENSDEYLAYMNKCNRNELTGECTEIFDLRQQFNGMSARVKSMEPQIVERIQIERDRIMKKIKENNSGQNAKAAKFFTAGLETGKNVYFPENKRQI